MPLISADLESLLILSVARHYELFGFGILTPSVGRAVSATQHSCAQMWHYYTYCLFIAHQRHAFTAWVGFFDYFDLVDLCQEVCCIFGVSSYANKYGGNERKCQHRPFSQQQWRKTDTAVEIMPQNLHLKQCSLFWWLNACASARGRYRKGLGSRAGSLTEVAHLTSGCKAEWCLKRINKPDHFSQNHYLYEWRFENRMLLKGI